MEKRQDLMLALNQERKVRIEIADLVYALARRHLSGLTVSPAGLDEAQQLQLFQGHLTRRRSAAVVYHVCRCITAVQFRGMDVADDDISLPSKPCLQAHVAPVS